jgi:hypothetical protein
MKKCTFRKLHEKNKAPNLRYGGAGSHDLRLLKEEILLYVGLAIGHNIYARAVRFVTMQDTNMATKFY